jgi:phage shock protein E
MRAKGATLADAAHGGWSRTAGETEESVMRIAILLGLMIIGLVGLASLAMAAEHTKDSLDTVKQAVADGKAILLDVRETSEWNSGHLKDARLLPLSVLKTGAKAEDVARVGAKGKIVYCHCGSGVRCLKAADELKKLGCDVRPLKAGYVDLLRAGFAPAAK